MSANPSELGALCERVSATRISLRTTPSSQIVDALVDTAQSLLKHDSPFFREAVAQLPKQSGLTQPMVAWALQSSMTTVTRGALQRVLDDIDQTRSPGNTPPRLAAVILSGNILTAPLRAVFTPLLARCPVVVKASSKEGAFVRLLHRALMDRDPGLAQSVGVVTFAGGDTKPEQVLFEHADVVTAFGTDETLAAIKSRLPLGKALLGHGHGFGVAYIPASALDRGTRWIRSVALDVAAYDQRGCLSPQAVWVQRGGSISPRDFAALLSRRGLTPVAHELPRGPLPEPIAAAQMQWRGVARATGELFSGDDHAVSYETATSFRPTPGYRNVAVRSASSWHDFLDQVSPFAPHLKCVGIADERLPSIDDLQPRDMTARLCSVGTMQTPPFALETEGRKPWAGLY